MDDPGMLLSPTIDPRTKPQCTYHGFWVLHAHVPISRICVLCSHAVTINASLAQTAHQVSTGHHYSETDQLPLDWHRFIPFLQWCSVQVIPSSPCPPTWDSRHHPSVSSTMDISQLLLRYSTTPYD
ncbi:hypothetical protein PAXRUDRAFT_834658 [Paxillus rubicundulus Ve08.2h10]|uniref:Uncharacterized protein n=1 Tax=Paxillus rubicundulus Ve08.2h10 TaxID=930991 RepID=A0A0D0CS69_9AGAM|nr:hypothetical protein PAXRUDRAFT_834658 [Paxillus rubicundulus Ve08.2h10]